MPSSSSYSSTTASSFSTVTSTTTRTTTTTTLSTLASPTILALKRQALQAKKAGDIETAKERLRQAKSIEQTLSFLLTTAGVVAVSNDNNNNNNNNNSTTRTTAINSLQQLATLLQQHGNEPAAIEALRQVELLQRQDDEKETTTGAGAAADSSSSSSSAVLAADIVDNDTRDTPQQQQQQQQQKQAQQTDNENEAIEQLKEQDDLSPEDPVNKIMDDANLDELNHNNNNNNNETQHFSNEELLDAVILQDMRAAGMDIPTAEEYQTRIAACKRAALQAKNNQNDLKTAKRQLLLSKQLEQAMHVLYCSSNDDDNNSKNNNNSNTAAADDDGEDYSLLDELMMDNENNTKQQQQQDDGFLEQLFGTSSSNTLDLDDLDHFDPLMLREMMEAGMQVPAVDDVLQKAQASKTTAIRYKQKGDILSAKTALEESKRLEKRAHQLAEMLAATEKLTKNDGDDDHHDNVNDDFNEKDHDNNILQDPDAMLAALEAQAAESMAHSMTRTSKKSKGNNKLKEPVSQEAQQQQSQQQPQSHPQLESSHTYKVQAVQYKQQGNMKEAVKALRLYKQALAAEERAAKVQQRQDCIDALQAEAKTANKQVNYFCYYQRFIDETVGHTQLVAWKTYAQQCADTIQKLENNDGESSVPLNRNADSKLLLQEIQETNGLNFIAKTCDPDDARIEICILDVFDLHTNKNLRTLLGTDRDFSGNVPLPSVVSIRVLVTVQLPPNMEAPDDNTKLHYEPISLQENHYVFGKSQFVHAERGPTRFAKLLARRMVRRRIVLEVFHTAKKGSLFSRTTEETLLGTAVIVLKDLLQSNVIAGEFPLLDHARRREVGGYMRCAIRTGSPFAEMKVEETSKKPETASNAELSSSAVIMHAFSPFVLQP